MLEALAESMKEKHISEFLSELSEYLLFMAGALAFLLLIILVSLLQVTNLPSEITEVVTLLLFIPFIMDLMLLSPNLPVLLLFFFLIPLLLIIAVIFRMVLARISTSKLYVLETITGKIKYIIKKPERKYGLATLFAVSIGATIGPSTFVLSPYSVKHYGWYALPGMMLASICSVALAYGYSKMFYYSKMLKGKIVGGPSFVGNAFGTKHYLYIVARFTMWIGNVALASFNLLITLSLVTDYIIPFIIPGFNMETYGSIILALKVLLFIILAFVVIMVYKHWESVVSMQVFLASIFISLLIIHMFFIVGKYNLELTYTNILPKTPISFGLLPEFLLSTFMSAAYVYLMVFGFQEVQSLAENVKTSSEKEEDKLKEISSKLKWAMVGGTLFSSLVFCVYISIYIALSNMGYEIPETHIPALDLLKMDTISYTFTLLALLLGVLTTYVPAFVAALKHLRELSSDVFLVKVEELRVKVDPYIIIFFMGLLLLTNAEYIIRLTDFAVLLSLTIIAFSEYALKRKVGKKEVGIFKNFRIFSTTVLTILIIGIFALTSQEVAVNSVVFMIFSTLIIMFFSYDLLLAELFALVMGILSLIITQPLVGVITELASYGIAGPTDVAIAQTLTASMWILRFIFLALITHLIIQYREDILNIAKALAIIFVKIAYELLIKIKELTEKVRSLKIS